MKTKTIRLKRWKVEVLQPTFEPTARTYHVIAVDPMDARIMAYMLDGGSQSDGREFDGDYVELVKEYTRILEVSSA
jgi:hypothetical protein